MTTDHPTQATVGDKLIATQRPARLPTVRALSRSRPDYAAVVDFRTAVDRLLNQVGHWEQSRWAAGGRADRVFALIQHLADAAADAEGGPRRPVPRLHDLVLPDQLRVMADDLIRAGAGEAAEPEVEAVRATL